MDTNENRPLDKWAHIQRSSTHLSPFARNQEGGTLKGKRTFASRLFLFPALLVTRRFLVVVYLAALEAAACREYQARAGYRECRVNRLPSLEHGSYLS